MSTGTIDTRSIELLCEVNNFHKWYMTSAKDGTGVDTLFEDISRVMIEHQKQKWENIRNTKSAVNLNDRSNGLKRICHC